MIYEYSCPLGHHFERVLPAADYQSRQVCECGAIGRRIISVPRLVSVQKECNYDSPIDGRPITSWKQREEDLARSGCRPYDPGMRQDVDRFHKQVDAELDRSVDAHIDAAFEKMPARQREQLENEVKSGASAEIIRRSV